MARALNSLQTKIAESTAQARANPFASGQLFQNVPLVGTLVSGPTASRPPSDGLPEGFSYFDETLGEPLWLAAGNWVLADGTIDVAASAGALATTNIDHGFGSPAVGVIITNVKNAVIHTLPRLVLYGDEKDNNVAQISFSYSELATAPTADFYLYR